jgi:hypothetical protein
MSFQFLFISDKYNDHYVGRPTCVSVHNSANIYRGGEKVLKVVEESKTHIPYPVPFYCKFYSLQGNFTEATFIVNF